MHRAKRLAAGIAAAATLAAVVPATGSAATTPVFPSGLFPTGQDTSQICLKGVYDPGPFGPMGPYGPLGPYGKDGPLNGKPNPLGDVASCGGLFTYILRGGNVASFVQANLHPGG